MTCSHCGGDNPPDALFCRQCGRPLARSIEGSAYRPFERQTAELVPRDVGQLVSETINIYQRDFRAFLLIASVPQVPLLLSVVTPFWLSVLLSLVGAAIYFLANGAIIHAVSQRYLVREIDVGTCVQRVLEKPATILITYILVSLALIGAGILAAFIIGIPIFFYLLVSWFFAGQVIMIEHKGSFDALERSRALVTGTWWRVFGIGAAFVLVVLGAVLATTIVLVLVSLGSTPLAIILQAIAHAMIFPILPIGATLVYLDLRVRKENYTLDAFRADVGL